HHLHCACYSSAHVCHFVIIQFGQSEIRDLRGKFGIKQDVTGLHVPAVIPREGTRDLLQPPSKSGNVFPSPGINFSFLKLSFINLCHSQSQISNNRKADDDVQTIFGRGSCSRDTHRRASVYHPRYNSRTVSQGYGVARRILWQFPQGTDSFPDVMPLTVASLQLLSHLQVNPVFPKSKTSLSQLIISIEVIRSGFKFGKTESVRSCFEPQ
ncbi:CMP-N-acetylneuraminate-beta-galactosamide-alpha-2 3-sialyltransferase, partial [Striga asiatica]